MNFWCGNIIQLLTFACCLHLVACNTVSDGALQDFSERLISKDTNNAAKYVTVNLQGRRRKNLADTAPLPLLTVKNKTYDIPSISKLVKIYDNYVPDVNMTEVRTDDELKEEHEFIDEVCKTPVIEEMKSWLQEKSLLPKDMDGEAFNKWLFDLWFTMYSRVNRTLSSSGFEHVFLGEINNKTVTGFHSWIYFADQESKGNVNYLGWKRNQHLQEKVAELEIAFRWFGAPKFVGSMFVGTSPELEIALFTTCFLARPNSRCKLQFNGSPLVVQTWSRDYNGKKYMGAAYPLIIDYANQP